ncbi:MAG TPA: chitobiase/beta-hexosaminidase C-terminal domain-containing protein [Candidatus Wallbacteria bacterium]|nr:chitobiase/beta-hexosaminidase C-terminal domain-containing protein [Candidatus Wallbacteria bacterium]
MIRLKSMFAGVAVLIMLLLGVSFIAGCGGGGAAGIGGYFLEKQNENDDTNNNATTGQMITVELTAPDFALSSAVSASPARAVDSNDGRLEIAVVNKDNPSEEIGTASLNPFSFSIPIGSQSKTAMIIIREKATQKIVSCCLLGVVPNSSQVPSAVKNIVVKGITINAETTAKAILAIEKNVVPTFPFVSVSSAQTDPNVTVDYTGQKSPVESAVESKFSTSTIDELEKAVETVCGIVKSSSVSSTLKNSIVTATNSLMSVSQVLTSFVNISKSSDSSVTSVINSKYLSTSVKLSNTTINSQTGDNTIVTVTNDIVALKTDYKAPTLTSVSISPVSVHTGEYITVTFTASEALANIPTVVILGRNALVTKISGNSYNAVLQTTLSDSGTVAFSISSYIDLAGNAGGTVTATTDGSTCWARATAPTNVVTPIFSISSGTYSEAQTVTITTATAGATIRYTLDGSTPSATNGTVYSAPITISSTTTIKAIATKANVTNSDIASATYTINLVTLQAAAPEFSHTAGTYTSTQSVSITSATAGATITGTRSMAALLRRLTERFIPHP